MSAVGTPVEGSVRNVQSTRTRVAYAESVHNATLEPSTVSLGISLDNFFHVPERMVLDESVGTASRTSALAYEFRWDAQLTGSAARDRRRIFSHEILKDVLKLEQAATEPLAATKGVDQALVGVVVTGATTPPPRRFRRKGLSKSAPPEKAETSARQHSGRRFKDLEPHFHWSPSGDAPPSPKKKTPNEHLASMPQCQQQKALMKENASSNAFHLPMHMLSTRHSSE